MPCFACVLERVQPDEPTDPTVSYGFVMALARVKERSLETALRELCEVHTLMFENFCKQERDAIKRR